MSILFKNVGGRSGLTLASIQENAFTFSETKYIYCTNVDTNYYSANEYSLQENEIVIYFRDVFRIMRKKEKSNAKHPGIKTRKGSEKELKN